MKRFNVTGVCVPGKHYMVNISGKLAQIKEMVDYGDYFTINPARQYGKTTTLSLLEDILKGEYIVASISFEGLGDESFESEGMFCAAFIDLVGEALEFADAPDGFAERWHDADATNFRGLARHITKVCRPGKTGSGMKLVLIIDEVDKTSNNRTCLHFLGLLRDKYLKREQNKDYTFHSVILAGVYDIKNIKLKMINEGAYTPAASENKLYNSPWNIAANFRVDMSFDATEISTMLAEYEADHSTGMDVRAIAEEIYSYTSGYPFLVTRICQCIEEELGKDWTHHGVRAAVGIMLGESNTLFDDMIKNLENNAELYGFLYDLLFIGNGYELNADNPVISLGLIDRKSVV